MMYMACLSVRYFVVSEIFGSSFAVFELTFQNVPTLQLLHIRSLAQPPAEKHQNHVLNHRIFR